MKKTHLKKRRLRLEKKNEKSFRNVFPLVACLFLTISVAAVGMTYAWFSSTDSVTNRFEGAMFSPDFGAKIEEVFTPPTEWAPGKTQVKEVRVRNTGTVAGFVRVSLKEAVCLFKVDGTTGNLVITDTAASDTINDKDGSQWKEVAEKNGTYKYSDGKYYTAVKGVSYTTYDMKAVDRSTTIFSPLTLNFSDVVFKTPPPNGTSNYWLYKDGYFYYSELVESGGLTSMLLKSVTLANNMPNKYKGMLYHIKPVMDAHDASKEISTGWGIGTSGVIYDMYKDKLPE